MNSGGAAPFLSLLSSPVIDTFTRLRRSDPDVASLVDQFERLPKMLDDDSALHFIGTAAKRAASITGAGFHISLTLDDNFVPAPTTGQEGPHQVPVFLHVPCDPPMDCVFREHVEKCANANSESLGAHWEEPCTLAAVLCMKVDSPDAEEVERAVRAKLAPCLMSSYLRALQNRSDEEYKDLTVYVAVGREARCVLRADEALLPREGDVARGTPSSLHDAPLAHPVWRELHAFIRAHAPQLDRDLVGPRVAMHIHRRQCVDRIQGIIRYLHQRVLIQEGELHTFVEDRMKDPQVMNHRGGKASRRRKFAREWRAEMEKKGVPVYVQHPSFM